MADGQCQGVGDVRGAVDGGETEELGHHVLDLLLGGGAVADQAQLDLVGRVLDDLAAPVAAATSARPLACPTDMAVRALTRKKTRSTTTE